MPKLIKGLLIVGFVLALGYLYLYNVTSIGYEQTSFESIELHNKAIVITETLKCTPNEISDRTIQQLKTENPGVVIATKGTDLIVDGFLFECVKGDANVFKYKEAKN